MEETAVEAVAYVRGTQRDESFSALRDSARAIPFRPEAFINVPSPGFL